MARGSESEEAHEEGGKKKAENVDEDVMDWAMAKRRTKKRTPRGKEEEESRKSGRMVQIFVKVDGSQAIAMEVAVGDKTSDIVKGIRAAASVTCT